MNNKDIRVTIRINNEEKLEFDRRAKEAGATLSQWVRNTLNSKQNIAGGTELVKLIAENSKLIDNLLAGKDNASYRHKLIQNLDSISTILNEVLKNE